MSDFLLTSPLAQAIHAHIAEAPIFDFHTHLPQDEILNDHRFENLWELWLKYDHYKWRLMRGCGVPESHITGAASPEEKFQAFAHILPLAIGNPVHQWVSMELNAVFGITTPLNEETASEIWNQANEALQTDPTLTVRGLLKKFRVALVCTTDDPTTDLSTHLSLAEETDLETIVLPTFRPDRFCYPHQPDVFSAAMEDLEKCTGETITTYDDLITLLRQRHDDFHTAGCRLSDHGLPYCPTGSKSEASHEKLTQILQETRQGQVANEESWNAFAGALLREIARWNHEKDWTLQLHLGPLRNINSRLFKQTGPDTGFDTMGNRPQTEALIPFLDRLNLEKSLPKTILYNLNPNESEALCCALQSFQEGLPSGQVPTSASPSSPAGKLQYGPAWWHLDHVRGIREQIDILASLSALGTSIGMLTDSRSFTSYVRHDYYRRILSSYLADKSLSGEMPADIALLKATALKIAHKNAQIYLGI